MLTTYFDKWLKKNINQFKYKPIKIAFGRYIFEGIIENITLFIDNDNCEIDIYFDNDDGENYDHLDIGYIQRARHIKTKGYTDLDWIDEYKNRFYPTYKEILIKNLFEPLIQYCDDYFIEKNHLYLADMSSVTFAMIGNSSEGKDIISLEKNLNETSKKINLEKNKYTKIQKLGIFIDKKLSTK